MEYIKNPASIENRSFEIIGEELGIKTERFDANTLKIVKRVIHTTADFDFVDLLKFNGNVVEKALDVLGGGCDIYVDTRMIMAGINKGMLSKYNCNVYNLSHEKDVMEEAKSRGVSRSMVGIEKAFDDVNTKIFVVGNAPTALFHLKDLIMKHNRQPELIIGVPVGFVGASESKDELMKMDIPNIAVQGRKGGSTVAVAIMNALLYMI